MHPSTHGRLEQSDDWVQQDTGAHTASITHHGAFREPSPHGATCCHPSQGPGGQGCGGPWAAVDRRDLTDRPRGAAAPCRGASLFLSERRITMRGVTRYAAQRRRRCAAAAPRHALAARAEPPGDLPRPHPRPWPRPHPRPQPCPQPRARQRKHRRRTRRARG